MKPMFEFFDTPEGILFKSAGDLTADKFFTSIIVLTQALVDHGHKVDDLMDSIKKYTARAAAGKLEKAIKQALN